MMTLVSSSWVQWTARTPSIAEHEEQRSAMHPATTASQLELEWSLQSAHNRICQAPLAQQETARNGG